MAIIFLYYRHHFLFICSELCSVFHCSPDQLFREEPDRRSDKYSDLRVEKVPGFRYVRHIVISADPESDAIGRVRRYAAFHIDKPFDRPFVTIPGAYGTLNDYMRTNGLTHAEDEVIPCFETDGESMDVYIAVK